MRADSLYRVMQHQPADTGSVMACFYYGDQYYPHQADSAGFYYLKGLHLAQQLHYQRGVAIFTLYYINVLNLRGEYARSLHLATQAAVIFQALNDGPNLLAAYNNIGNQYQEMGNFPAAVNYYLKALALAEQYKKARLQNKIYNNLASVFFNTADYDKSYLYASRANNMARAMKDTGRIAAAMVNLGAALTRLKHYEKGIASFNEVIQLGRYLGDSTLVMDGLINNGSIYSDHNQHQRALELYEQTMAITDTYHDQDYRLYAQLGYGQELLKTGQPAKADKVIAATIALAQRMQANDELRQTYLTAAEIKEALQQPAQALQYRKLYEALNDSLVGAGTRKQVHQLEIAFQTAEKDKALAEKRLQLAQKDLELAAKTKWQAIFLLTIALLAALAFLTWYRYRQRQKLHAQQVQTLEKEKTVQVLEALMQGEEKERVRLSKDLHDGVGGLLSAVKMHFSAIRHDQPVLQQSPAYAHAIGLLDDAITDIRKTAHNLMPETLYRLGLKEALQNFCRNISYSGTLQVSFYSLGEIGRFKPNFELSVYRIVQELVNNIIKHSRASEALVQLTQQDMVLAITVEDNGIGFNQQTARQQGNGLTSLQSRVRALNGNIAIDAATGQGTTAYIEFDISIVINNPLQHGVAS
jgi:signal transduction histidine kinase